MVNFFKVSFCLVLVTLSQSVFGQTASVYEGCAPLKVKFSAGQSLTAYFWDFKDDVTSILENPENLYTSAGTFKVSLQETVDGPILGTVTVVVHAPPKIQIQADNEFGCLPLNVKLDDKTVYGQGVVANTVTWFFDDGTSKVGKSVNKVFSNQGKSTVSVDIKTNYTSCNATQVFDDFIEVVNKPSVAFSTNPTNLAVCTKPLNVSLVNQSTNTLPVTYNWDFGNGKKHVGVTPPSQVYNAEGTFQISLSASYADGCSSVTSKSVSIGKPEPKIVLKDTVCTNSFIQVSTLFAGSSNWDFGNDACPKVGFGNTKTVVWNSGGIKNISLDVVTNVGNCTGEDSFSLFVDDSPLCKATPRTDFVLEFDSVCANEKIKVSASTSRNVSFVSYRDSLFQGNFNLDKSDTLLLEIGGMQEIKFYEIESSTSCKVQSSKFVHVHDVKPDSIISTPTHTCAHDAIFTLSAVKNLGDSDLNYKWYLPDSLKTVIEGVDKIVYTHDYLIDNDEYSVNTTEIFDIKLVIESLVSGCSDSVVVSDTAYLPNAEFFVSQSFGCIPLNVTFKGESIPTKGKLVSYNYFFGDGNSKFIDTEDVDPFTHNYTSTGVFESYLVVTDEDGCVDTSYFVAITVGDTIASQVQIDYTINTMDDDSVFVNMINNTPKDLVTGGFQFDTKQPHCYDGKTVPTYAPGDLTGLDLEVDYNGCLSTATLKDTFLLKYFYFDGFGGAGELPDGVLKPGFDLRTYLETIGYDKKNKYKLGYFSLCEDPLTAEFVGADTVAEYFIDFGDGNTSELLNTSHTYDSSGNYVVKLMRTIPPEFNACEDSIKVCAIPLYSTTVKVREVEAKIAMLDTIVCLNTFVTFDASASVDVDTLHHRGYKWVFPELLESIRPYSRSYPLDSFVFSTPGVFNVQLLAEDLNGCVDTTITKFTVAHLNPAISMSDSSICLPQTVNFEDKTSSLNPIVKWTWDLRDEKDSSFIKNPVFHYDTVPVSGTSYQLSLLVEDSLGCKDKKNFSLKYYVPQTTINFTNGANRCINDTINFSGSQFTSEGSLLGFVWRLDGDSISNIDSGVLVFDTAGSHSLELSFVEEVSGCSGTRLSNFSIQDYPIAGFASNFDSSGVLCAPLIVQLRDSSISNYTLSHYWNTGNGITSFASSVNFIYKKGTWDVEHRVSTSNGCSDTIFSKFNVLQPEGDFTLSTNSICKYESIDFALKDTVDVGAWEWFFGDGSSLANKDNVTNVYEFHPPSTITKVRLQLTNVTGDCTNEIEKPISIKPIIADFRRQDGVDTVSCFERGEFRISNVSTNADNVEWDFGDGTRSTDINITGHQFPRAGTYEVKLNVSSNQFSCVDTIIKTVLIYPTPQLSVFDTVICEGTEASLYVSNQNITSSYKWSPDESLSNAEISNPTASPSKDIVYTVVETDTNGCFNSDSLVLSVLNKPDLYDWDTTIVIGDSISLPVTGAERFLFAWEPEKGIKCFACDFTLVQPLESTLYTLTISDTLNCFDGQHFKYNVNVHPETFIKMPTIFTPNGDDVNEEIFVKGWGIKELKLFEIYNRWGQLVFETKDLNVGWDGKMKGKLQNEDIYIYKIQVMTWKDEVKFLEGQFNLIR